MKKLMVMLSAAAMAFGLFADGVPTYKTSFETGDECVQDGVFTADGTTWSGFTAPITLKKDAAKPACYGTGDLDRREEFAGQEDAHQYLPLETGKDTLNLAKGDVFLDQIVKFTGFEEAQTQFGDAKIAIWMSAIEDDPDTTEVDEADTNLYVAVGSETGAQNVKLIYDVEPDTWYRLTIKKLENPILAADGNKLGGFIIYINGEQVGYDPTTTALYPVDDLSSEAKSYATAGQLFPAMVADETFANTFASVGYNGIGAIDDIVVDEKGPKFTQFVEGTVGLIADATLVITNLAGGAAIEYDPVTGKFQAAPNSNLKFIYTAAEGKFLAPEGKQEVVYSEQITQNNKDFRDLVKDVEAKTAVAGVSSDEDYIYYASLQEAITATTGTEEFPAGVKLFADTAENVTVAADKYIELDMAGFSLNNKSNYYTIENKGYLSIYDSRENVEDVADLAVIGFVKDASWTYASSTIRNLGTLEISGIKVYNDTFIAVKNDEDLAKEIVGVCTLNGVVFDGADQSVQNWGTLTINGGIYNKVFTWAEPTCNSGYTEIYDGTFNDAVASVQQYNDTIGWSETPAMVKIYGGTFNAKVYGTYTTNFKGEDPERGTIEIYPADEEEEIPGGIFAEANKPNVAYIVNTPAEGYQNAWVAAEEAGYVTPGEELIPTYVAKIGGVEYTSLADAFAAAVDGDVIELLADIETTRVDIDASKSVTLNMAGKKITLKTTEADAREQLIVWGGLNDTLQTGKLTITGEGEMDASNAAAGIAVWARYGDIDIQNGTYTVYGQGECVFARNGSKVTIEDGTFTNYATGSQCGDVLNALNTGSVLDIQVTGGLYSKDPAEGDDFLGPTFVAPGYASVKQESGLWKVGAAIIATFTVEGDVYTAETNIVAFTPATPTAPVVEGKEFKGWLPEIKEISESTEFVAQLEPIATDITVTVKKGTGIDTVTVDDVALDFDANDEATFTVKPDALTAQVVLAATSDITIPVFQQTIGKDAEGYKVVSKAVEFKADAEDQAKNYVTYVAVEADETDPTVDESQKKTAIIDAIDGEAGEPTHDAAVAKVNQVVTTEETPAEGKVTATELARWITTKSVSSAALAGSDYIVASVKLGTDAAITTATPVEVATVDKTSSDLAVTIKVAGQDATKEQIEGFVQVCDDLGAANDWEKLPESTLKSAVKIEAGKLVITPVAGVDKLFLKVVIPQDAK